MELSQGRLRLDRKNGHNSVTLKMKALLSSESSALNTSSTEKTIKLINTYRGNVEPSVYLYLFLIFMSEQ